MFVCSEFDRGYCPYQCSASRCKVLIEASLWQYWQQTENRTRLAFCFLSPQSNQLVPPDYFDHMMVVNRTIKRPSRQKGTIATRIRWSHTLQTPVRLDAEVCQIVWFHLLLWYYILHYVHVLASTAGIRFLLCCLSYLCYFLSLFSDFLSFVFSRQALVCCRFIDCSACFVRLHIYIIYMFCLSVCWAPS